MPVIEGGQVRQVFVVKRSYGGGVQRRTRNNGKAG
jgi:hypothetical protein